MVGGSGGWSVLVGGFSGKSGRSLWGSSYGGKDFFWGDDLTGVGMGNGVQASRGAMRK
jgi:hypothetical protein